MVCLVGSSYLAARANEKRTETEEDAEMDGDFLHSIFGPTGENGEAGPVVSDANNKADDDTDHIAVPNPTVTSNSPWDQPTPATTSGGVLSWPPEEASYAPTHLLRQAASFVSLTPFSSDSFREKGQPRFQLNSYVIRRSRPQENNEKFDHLTSRTPESPLPDHAMPLLIAVKKTNEDEPMQVSVHYLGRAAAINVNARETRFFVSDKSNFWDGTSGKQSVRELKSLLAIHWQN